MRYSLFDEQGRWIRGATADDLHYVEIANGGYFLWKRGLCHLKRNTIKSPPALPAPSLPWFESEIETTPKGKRVV